MTHTVANTAGTPGPMGREPRPPAARDNGVGVMRDDTAATLSPASGGGRLANICRAAAARNVTLADLDCLSRLTDSGALLYFHEAWPAELAERLYGIWIELRRPPTVLAAAGKPVAMTPTMRRALRALFDRNGEAAIGPAGVALCAGSSLSFMPVTWLRLITIGMVEPAGRNRIRLTTAGRARAAEYRP